MSQYWKGIWQGGGAGRELFSYYILTNKNIRNDALKTCKVIPRHCQRIVPLHNDERFTPSLCFVFLNKNLAVSAENCETPSSWLVLIFSTEPKMCTLIGHRISPSSKRTRNVSFWIFPGWPKYISTGAEPLILIFTFCESEILLGINLYASVVVTYFFFKRKEKLW